MSRLLLIIGALAFASHAWAAFTISSTTPSRNQMAVSPDTDIVVSFSAAPISDAFESIVVHGQFSGQRTFSVTASGNDWTIAVDELSPGKRFFPGEHVYVTILASVTDGVEVLPAPRTVVFDIKPGSGSANFNREPATAFSSDVQGKEMLAADVDADGDIDLIAAGAAHNSVFLNVDQGRFEAGAQFGEANCTLALGDIDGDGFVDVVVGSSSNTHRCAIYWNDGSGGFSDQDLTDVALATSNVLSVAVADMDCDGDMDVLCGTASGEQNSIYLNDGSGAFGWTDGEAKFATTSETSIQVIPADMDCDGDMDVVVREQTPFSGDNAYVARVYRNGMISGSSSAPVFGTLTFTASVRFVPYVNSTSKVQRIAVDTLADPAGNLPYPDVVSASSAGGDSKTHISQGFSGYNPLPYTLLSSDTGISALAVADFNNDGLKDTMYGASSQGSEHVRKLVLTTGHANYATPANVGQSGSASTGLVAADFDGDGDIDIAETRGDASGQLYFNGSTPHGSGMDADSTIALSDDVLPLEIDSIAGTLAPTKVFAFRITDAGSGDGQPTRVTSITVTNDSVLSASGHTWTLVGTGLNVTGTATEGGITFSSLSIEVADGQSYECELMLQLLSRVSFKGNYSYYGSDPDGHTFHFSLSPSSVVTGEGGSRMDLNLSALSGAQTLKYQVVATRLRLTQELPAIVTSGIPFSMALAYADASDNLDKDVNDTVSIRKTGAIPLLATTAATGGKVSVALTLTSSSTETMSLNIYDDAAGAVDLSASPLQTSTFTLESFDPTLSSLTPAAGTRGGGKKVTIVGTGMQHASRVTFHALGLGNAFTGTELAHIDNTKIEITTPSIGLSSDDQFADVVVTFGTLERTLSSAYEFVRAPFLSTFSPTTGAYTGGTTLTVNGGNFDLVDEIEIEGVATIAAANFLSQAGNAITLAMPAASPNAVVHIIVRDLGKHTSDTSTATFKYGELIGLTSVTPNQVYAAGGQTLGLKGWGLATVDQISFSSTSTNLTTTTFTVVDDETIAVIAPAGVEGESVTVRVTDLQSGDFAERASAFTYSQNPALWFYAITPDSGDAAGGELVTISGINLDDVGSIAWRTSQSTISISGASLTHINDGSLSFLTPPGNADEVVGVTLVKGDGSASTTVSSVFRYLPAPVVPEPQGMTPDAGPLTGGTLVTISGENLGTITELRIEQQSVIAMLSASEFTWVSGTPDSIAFVMPPLPALGQFHVVLSDGDSDYAVTGTFTAHFAVDDITPNVGPTSGGNLVSIHGLGLASVTEVRFGTKQAQIESTSTDQRLDVIPRANSAGTVQIQLSDGTHTLSAGNYEFNANIPVITALNPNHGPARGGNQIRVMGARLGTITNVYFGDVPATILSAGRTENGITVVVPSGIIADGVPQGARVVDVRATSADAETSLVGGYTYDASGSGGNDGDGGKATELPADSILATLGVCSLQTNASGSALAVILALLGLAWLARSASRKRAAVPPANCSLGRTTDV